MAHSIDQVIDDAKKKRPAEVQSVLIAIGKSNVRLTPVAVTILTRVGGDRYLIRTISIHDEDVIVYGGIAAI